MKPLLKSRILDVLYEIPEWNEELAKWLASPRHVKVLPEEWVK